MAASEIVSNGTSAKDLERMVRDKSEVLVRERAQNQHLQASVRFFSRLLRDLAHDIRGPIHGALGWTALLRREHLDSAARELALARVENAMRMQLALVEELLELSLLGDEVTDLELEQIDLGKMVGRAVEKMASRAKSSEVELTLVARPLAGMLFGDERRLEQAITNLLGNALRFTPAGGSVEVIVEDADAGRSRIEVKDTGRGILAHRLPGLFEPSRPQEKGTHVGLFVARRLVELHGGTVEVVSEGEGRGSTFTVYLPNHPKRGEAGTDGGRVSGVQPPARLYDVRVLAVVGERDTRELIASALGASGAKLAFAEPSNVLELVPSFAPDVSVVDLDDSVEAMRCHVLQRIPTVAVAQPGCSPVFPMGTACGVFLRKPLDTNRLVDAVCLARAAQ